MFTAHNTLSIFTSELLHNVTLLVYCGMVALLKKTKESQKPYGDGAVQCARPVVDRPCAAQGHS